MKTMDEVAQFLAEYPNHEIIVHCIGIDEDEVINPATPERVFSILCAWEIEDEGHVQIEAWGDGAHSCKRHTMKL